MDRPVSGRRLRSGRRHSAVLLQDRDAFDYAVIAYIGASARHKTPDFVGAAAAERTAQFAHEASVRKLGDASHGPYSRFVASKHPGMRKCINVRWPPSRKVGPSA